MGKVIQGTLLSCQMGHYPLLMGYGRKKDDANLSRKKLLYSYGPKVKVREVGNNILFFI